MKQRMGTAAALTLLALAGLPAAQAQTYAPPVTNPFQPPVVSPYLNLRRGGSPAVNYYGVIRPQEQTNASLHQLQQQVTTGQATLAGEAAALALPSTGHPTRFFNYSHYFFNQGGAGVVPAGTAPLAAAPLGGAGLGGAPFTGFPPVTGTGAVPPRPVR
jgi:hypothetical protein